MLILKERIWHIMIEHSEKYKLVANYYNRKLWNESKVRNAVIKGWITSDEFTEITGIQY
jgi:hypothetical protein